MSAPSREVRGFEDLCHSFLILLKWHELFVWNRSKRLSYCQSTQIFCESWKGPFLIKDITVYLNRIFVKSKTSRNGNVKSQSSREIRNTIVLNEFSTFLNIKSKEQNFFTVKLFLPYLRLTVKIFQFLRLSTKFWAVLCLSVNRIETLVTLIKTLL